MYIPLMLTFHGLSFTTKFYTTTAGMREAGMIEVCILR